MLSEEEKQQIAKDIRERSILMSMKKRRKYWLGQVAKTITGTEGVGIIEKEIVKRTEMFPDPDPVNLINGVTPEELERTVVLVATQWRLLGRSPNINEIWNTGAFRNAEQLNSIVYSAAFTQWMKALGHEWGSETINGLSAKQAMVIELLTNPHDKRSLVSKLNACKVTTREYNQWSKQPLFKQYIDAFAESALSNHNAAAINSLLGQVDKGSMDAIKYYFAMTGRYDPTSKNEREIRDVILQIIDVVTRNVSDPVALENISSEMFGILDSGHGGSGSGGSNKPSISIARIEPTSNHTSGLFAGIDSDKALRGAIVETPATPIEPFVALAEEQIAAIETAKKLGIPVAVPKGSAFEEE